jgi:hypothetical protein
MLESISASVSSKFSLAEDPYFLCSCFSDGVALFWTMNSCAPVPSVSSSLLSAAVEFGGFELYIVVLLPDSSIETRERGDTLCVIDARTEAFRKIATDFSSVNDVSSKGGIAGL